MQKLFNVYKNWVFTFKIGLPNYSNGYGDGFPFQSSIFKSDGRLQYQALFQPFIPLKLIKWVPGSPGDSAVKSKVSLHSDSVAPRQLNRNHKKRSYKVLSFSNKITAENLLKISYFLCTSWFSFGASVTVKQPSIRSDS